MSMHRSLKSKSGALNQHRNVLTRAERITKLADLDKFRVGANSALGLPKVRSIKAAVAKKPKKAEAAAAGGDAGAAPAAGGAKAAPAKSGAAAKAASPASKK